MLVEIRPLLVAAVIGLAALSAMRSHHQKSGHSPSRIPVRFEHERKPQRVEVKRPVD